MKEISDIELFKIGKIIKTHGFKGELVVKLDIEFDQILKTELFFVDIDGITVPFFLSQKIRPFKKSQMLLNFVDIDSDIKAEKFIDCDIFTDTQNIEDLEFDEMWEITGFKVYNNGEFIGTVKNFVDIPANPLLEIISDKNIEILVPYNENFIVNSDYIAREIYLNLPEGLLDLNV